MMMEIIELICNILQTKLNGAVQLGKGNQNLLL